MLAISYRSMPNTIVCSGWDTMFVHHYPHIPGEHNLCILTKGGSTHTQYT